MYPDAGYPGQLGPSDKVVDQAWLKGIDSGTYCNYNTQTLNCQCSLFSKKSPIIQIFCISGWFAIPINPYKWSYTILGRTRNISIEIEYGTDHFDDNIRKLLVTLPHSFHTSFHPYLSENLFEIIWETWHFSDNLHAWIPVSFKNKPS